MQKVSNKKCIRRLSWKTIKSARTRNIIAVLAITLTALLFTSLFTIALSVNKSFQEQNFRQAGGSSHGTFKNVTSDQMEALRNDPLVKTSGARLILGMPSEAPFLKSHVEVGYMEPECAELSFCVPEEGRLPKEGTMEAATDTRVLALLGVEPKLGETFTITYDLGVLTGHPQEVSSTFTLCGWWEYDEAGIASQVVVPKSHANEVLAGYECQGDEDVTGRWDVYVMLKNSLHIADDLKEILRNHGYQDEKDGQDNYIGTGVNWGYTGAQMNESMDVGTIAGVAAALLLIVLSGYLIIYNIFRISVVGDIRFYGLLKTIGTTGKQIRRIIRRQALLLSAIGIPLGLFLGWLVGAKLTPVVMSSLTYKHTSMSMHPLIFVGAALFSFVTVLLSCRKPAKIAGKVSPVEAVAYTEGKAGKKKEKKSEHGGRVHRMVLANLSRSKSKTVMVVVSLSLAVLLFNMTCTFTNGFDMDKYLEKYVCTDFIAGHADYFQSKFRDADQGVSEGMIADIDAQEGITESGRIYGQTTLINQYVPEDVVRKQLEIYSSSAKVDALIDGYERNEEGLLIDRVRLYGMEALPLSRLTVLEGDLSKLEEEGQIVAVVDVDDYDVPYEESNHYKVGEQMELKYVDAYEMVDSRTGEPAGEDTPDEYMEVREIKSHYEVYTVCARVTMRHTMSYRIYGTEQMILPADAFQRETNSHAVMSYLFNTTKESNAAMNIFLTDYTEKTKSSYDFESKQSYVDEFDGFRNMFLLMGSALSFIIGVIGILNFINAIATSMLSRKREFAVLQAVGMTGKQLKKMLVMEGCAYGMGAVAVAFVLNLIIAPLISDVLGNMFWFYSYHFTVWPILLMIPIFLLFGALVPLVSYRALGKQSLVERIREAES